MWSHRDGFPGVGSFGLVSVVGSGWVGRCFKRCFKIKCTDGLTGSKDYADTSPPPLHSMPTQIVRWRNAESHRPVCRPVRGESSSHIFREYAPAQRRVRLSPIESFVLNAATAADEQRRPRKINSCFYKTPESHSRPVETSARRELVSHFQRVRPRATARATESNRIICIERGDSRRRAAAPAENQFLFL